MELKSYHFYHPFKSSSFGILTPSLKDPDNVTGFALEDIDLYYQPLESPSIFFTFFVLSLISVFIGEGIGMKVLTMLKKELGPLTQITKLFVISQMILWPFFLLLVLTTCE